MKKVIFFIALLMPIIVRAQDTGIQFQTGMSWKKIQSKAKAEHKYIFVDCFATWCGPCKDMAQHVFPMKEVGDYFNEHFISVEVQMDKTAKDDQAVIDWYPVVKNFQDTYQIDSYPTFLFFSPDGQPVHRIVGARNEQRFLELSKAALSHEQQYYTLGSDYKNHLSDSAYLLKGVRLALDASDKSLATQMVNAYVSSVKAPITKENIQLISENELISSSKDDVFKLYLNNVERIDALWPDKGSTATDLKKVIFNEKIKPLYGIEGVKLHWANIARDLRQGYPSLGDTIVHIEEGMFMSHIYDEIAEMAQANLSPNWDQISQTLKSKYPGYDFKPAFSKYKVNYYADHKDWDACAKSVYELLQPATMLHSTHLDLKFNGWQRDFNDLLWFNVFLHCKDQKTLKLATKWMKWLVGSQPDEGLFLDSYAQFLFKIGAPKTDAVQWEQKAIDAMIAIDKLYPTSSKKQYLKEFRESLDKIINGQPTWLDSMPVPTLTK